MKAGLCTCPQFCKKPSTDRQGLWGDLCIQHLYLWNHQGVALLDMEEASKSFSQSPPLEHPHYKKQAVQTQNSSKNGVPDIQELR